MATRAVTLGDVAKLAGVSLATASRILSVPEGLHVPFSKKTQDKVRLAADMLGYKPSKLARGLTGTKTNMVGLVIPSVKDSYFPSVTDVIETQLAKVGYNVILSNTKSDPATERREIENMLSWRVDGLIVTPAETVNPEPYWQLWMKKVPFVLIDRCFPDTPFNSVTTDDYTGATLAVEHLVSIGRRRIARMGGSLSVSANKQRQNGYVDTLVRHGIVPDESLWFETSSRAVGRDIIHSFKERASLPDALFCFNDRVAVGAIEGCCDLGYRIPEDIAIVGYADLEYTDVLRVPLTTIRQPCDLLGQTASDALLALMDGKSPGPAQQVLPVELVIRDSTAPQPRVR